MSRRDSILVSRTLYQVGYISLITAIIWVGVGIYTASTKTTVVDVDPTILEPINPVLDQEVLKSLGNRLKIELDLSSVAPSTESASLAPTASASESASIEDTGGAR